MSRKTPKAVFCASEPKYTAAGGDVQVPWVGIHERWKSGTEGLIHGLLKQTQICMRFIAPWWRNRNFQRTQSFQFLNRSLFRSSRVVMNLKWRLKEYCRKNKQQRWNICEEFTVWHFVIKSTGLKCVKPRMSSHFSESRNPSYVSSANSPEAPGRNGELSPSGYILHHGKAAQSLSKNQFSWLHLRAFLFSSWCWASRNIFLDCYWSWGISGRLGAAAAATLPKGRSGNENE